MSSAAVQESRPAVAGNARRRDIQGLRAIAVLLVVAFHVGLPLPGGFAGVDVFFVISGFVITAMLRRNWQRDGKTNFAQFYWRRFKRLTPALALMVSVTMVASCLILSPIGVQQLAAKTAAGAMLLVANFVIAITTGGYFNTMAGWNPLLNTWSLSIEEQFYLVFPLLLTLGWWVSRRARRARWAPVMVVGTLTVLSFALAVYGSANSVATEPDLLTGFYSPLTRAWEFGVGALLVLLLPEASPSPGSRRTATGLLGLLGMFLLGLSALRITGATPWPGVWTLLPVAGAAALLVAGRDPDNPVSRALGTKPLVKVGDWSYSIYLWHWPIIVFAGVLWPGSRLVLIAAAAASFIPAVLSYRWVEEPIRRSSFPTPRQWVPLVAATMVVPLALAAVTWTTASFVWRPMAQASRPAPPSYPGLDQGCMWTYQGPQRVCTWNDDATGVPIYLVGDSNALHFGEGVIAAAQRNGQPVSMSTSMSCPFLLDISTMSKNCFVSNAFFKDWLTEAPPGVVILSNHDAAWLDADGVSYQRHGPTVQGGTQQAIDLYRESLTRTVRFLKDQGHQVILLQTIPSWTPPYTVDTSACSLWQMVHNTCHRYMPLEFATAHSAPTIQVVDEVGRQQRVPVLDIRDTLCPDGLCASHRDGVRLYRNDNHLTNEAAALLSKDFYEALRKAASRQDQADSAG